MLDFTKLNISPPLLDALSDTCYRILRIGYLEMYDIEYYAQTHSFAKDLPHLLLSYGFTTQEELELPCLLDREDIYSMFKLVNDVSLFHQVTDTPVVDKPTTIPENRLTLRKKLIDDENKEVQEALDKNNLAMILQENLDLIYVAVGTLIEAGLGEAAVVGWQALQDSNMRKVDPSTGKVIKREDGKVLKPENWVGVDWQMIVDRFSK